MRCEHNVKWKCEMQRRWLIGLRTLLLVVGMLCLTLGIATARASTAHASGEGPCSPITAKDLAQPMATPKGHEWVNPSRTQGTGGTLLSLAGGGWPANSPVEVDLATDSDGQLWYNGILSQTTTSASGALDTPQFRLPELAYCPYTTTPSSVTVLLIAHTPASGPFTGTPPDIKARQPIIFTYMSSPSFTFPAAKVPYFGGDAPAGASMPMTSAGWAPGERVTISPILTAWPKSNPAGARYAPINTPDGAQGAFRMTADAHGAFSVPYHLPAVAPASTVSFWVHADDARFGDIGFFASASFFILPATYPSLQLAQRTLVAGGTLTLAGDHWLPNQQGVIEYCGGLAYDTSHALYCNRYVTQTLGAFTTDSTGHFFAQVHLPINARLGDITVQAHIGDPSVIMSSESRVFAQAEPLTIVSVVTPLTYAQIHPRRVWLLAHAPYLAGGALAALAGLLIALRRRHGRAQPAA
jgi:hypothetical protein